VYRTPPGTRKVVGFEVVDVTRDGRPEPYHVRRKVNGKRVYIGRENVFLEPGVYRYELTYVTDRQIGFLEDHDELYWNVTGNDWAFPIREASATVRLPDVPPEEVGRTDAFTGRQGQQGKSYTTEIRGDATVTFATTRPLQPREGLSIVVTWPKGYVTEPTRLERFVRFLRDNWGMLIGVAGTCLVIGYYLIAWFWVGRDPEGGPIIPRYEPPDRRSPAACRFVRRMGYDHKTFASAVINMAVKGYLSIREEDGDYTVVRGEAGSEVLSAEEKKLARKLLGRSAEVELDRENHSRIKKAIDAVEKALRLAFEKTYFFTNKGYFIPAALFSVAIVVVLAAGHEPMVGLFMGIWLSVWTVGVLVLASSCAGAWRAALPGGSVNASSLGSALGLSLFVLPFVGGEVFGLILLTRFTSVAVPVVIAVLGTVNFLFYHWLKAPTRAGRALLDRIEGFRMYLRVAEKDRLNLLNPPERTPELFERYLPYALALDVEQQWAEQFTDLLRDAATEEGRGYSPTWYSGGAWSPARAGAFAGSLSGSFSSAIASSSTAPGSGSGGGGFSGGGGGGGGGGGW
jgi:uncharacterized membrane protein YgcG